MVEIITGGGNIAASLTALSADKSTGNSIFTGAISCLLGVFHKLKAAGVVLPVFSDPDAAKFANMGPSQMAATLTQNLLSRDARLGPRLAVLAYTVSKHRDGISFPKVAAPVPVPAPPIDVRVIGLPDRVTTTSVEHDDKGNIKTATQTERDAVQADQQAPSAVSS